MQVSFFALAIPMLVHLLRRRDVLAPPGIGLWILFLAWVLGGALLLQVDAPGAIPSQSSMRYLTFLFRFGWYVIGTIALLYVVTLRGSLSTQRIAHAVGWMFLVLVAGGLLAVIVPTLEFPSLLELLLPGSIAADGFVRGLIHPQVAQIHTFLGYAEARPSAPFAFTNEWGLCIAVTAPFFVVSWWRRGGLSRLAVPIVVALAAIPIVSSLNRGLWLALLSMLIFAAVRIGLKGHINALFLMMGSLVVGFFAIASSSFGDLIVERINTPHSNEGRTNLSLLAVDSAFRGSPFLGFGTTRDVQGNFSSIAGGATSLCPACSPPALGTQGQLWLLIFGAGFVGALLFLSFFIGQVLRHLRDASSYSIAAACSILASLVTMPVYNSVGPAIFICLIAVGVMHREGVRVRKYRLVDLFTCLRRNVVLIVVCALGGGLVGAGIQAMAGVPTAVTYSVLAPRNLTVGPIDARPLSMDSEAALARSGAVLGAVAAATGADPGDVVDELQITADPNTRILNITYTHPDADAASHGAEAAVAAFIELRDELAPGLGVSSGVAQVLRVDPPVRATGPWLVAIVSGLMLGATGGSLLALHVNRRIGRRRMARMTGLVIPTLARIPVAEGVGATPSGMRECRRVLGSYEPVCAVLADEEQPVAVRLAETLSTTATDTGALSGTRVLIVASSASKASSIQRLHLTCSWAGLVPVGVILIEE
ncbi:hypothetical protein [Ornithinimicrobium murale]|uniref:hypothetical protein n=1 Tax=Ornithinimicrobium murale TaxID=1050153 RepID=UPI0013B3F235|nr:hypothetical protein [Ornithinimicrobium murale]